MRNLEPNEGEPSSPVLRVGFAGHNALSSMRDFYTSLIAAMVKETEQAQTLTRTLVGQVNTLKARVVELEGQLNERERQAETD